MSEAGRRHSLRLQQAHNASTRVALQELPVGGNNQPQRNTQITESAPRSAIAPSLLLAINSCSKDTHRQTRSCAQKRKQVKKRVDVPALIQQNTTYTPPPPLEDTFWLDDDNNDRLIDRNLRANERRMMQERDVTKFCTIQKDVTAYMRAVLTDWLVEVAEEFKLQQQTLLLTINYVDRVLSKIQVSKYSLQLLGVSCMLIASKFEEISPPTVDDFVYISDNTYNRAHILQMEQDVLNNLGFSMCAATFADFLGRFIEISGYENNDKVRWLSNYLAELTLIDIAFWKYSPSEIAAAVIRLALHTLGLPLVQAFEFEQYTRYARSQLDELLEALLVLYRSMPNNQLKGIYTKYMQAKFSRVASIAPPSTLPA